MISRNETLRMIFGFKLRYLRLKYGKSYQQISEATGLSTSYLNDIEKGKKYPKPDKIQLLAEAFDLSYDDLVSMKSDKRIQPVIDLVNSDFFTHFPLEEFGIHAEKLLDVFTNSPDKINAFISTIIKMVRSYQIEKEDFNRVALRSFQDIHNNYFSTIEAKAISFRQTNKLPLLLKTPSTLEKILTKQFGYTIDREKLAGIKKLKGFRFYFNHEKSVLYLNSGLSKAQECFIMAKEIGFQVLELSERPYEIRLNKEASFDKLLNNFRASYFAISLMMDEDELCKDLEKITESTRFESSLFLNLLKKYKVTPEMLLQRLTNILPQRFGLNDLFFIKLNATSKAKEYVMIKELHLSRIHNPYNNQLHEHFCRRWISIGAMKTIQRDGDDLVIDAQISQYPEQNHDYFCITIAQKSSFSDSQPSSVTIGLLINPELRATFPFLRDPDLKTKHVNTTCERCAFQDCDDRVAAPIIIERAQAEEKLEAALEKLK